MCAHGLSSYISSRGPSSSTTSGCAPPLTPPPPPPPPPQLHIAADVSPPGSIKQLRRQLRGLREAQTIPGQEASVMAGRAQQISELSFDLEEREHKLRKYGR